MVQIISACCEACGFRLHGYSRPAPDIYPDCPTCQTPLVRLWTGDSTPRPIGDECDVTVKHGICWPDGTPRRYGSKSEMKRVAASKGLQNIVEHKTSPDTDKSKHTSRWI